MSYMEFYALEYRRGMSPVQRRTGYGTQGFLSGKAGARVRGITESTGAGSGGPEQLEASRQVDGFGAAGGAGGDYARVGNVDGRAGRVEHGRSREREVHEEAAGEPG